MTANTSPRSPIDGIPVAGRGTVATLAAFVRNPITATPPECYSQPLVWAPLFGRPRLYIVDPVLIRDAYVRQSERLSKGPVVPRLLEEAFGDGLLSAEGEHWRHQRRAAAPAFAPSEIAACLPSMITAATVTRDRLLSSRHGVDLGRAMTATTFSIVAETMLSGAIGADSARYERELNGYLASINWRLALALGGLPAALPFPGRRRAAEAASWLRGTVTAMVVARRNGPGSHPSQDLVSLLLSARDPATGRGLNDAEVTDNILTFIAAGHETTAQGLVWTLRLLADAPEVEAGIVEEVHSVTNGGPLRPDHVARLVKTRDAFSEAMRLFPPVPLIERRTETDLSVGGHRLRAGTTLVVPIHALHRHVALWEEPIRFDPSRFSTERAATRDRHAYMPFGAGPRTCIGASFAIMEAVTVLGVLLRELRFTPLDPVMPSPLSRLTLRPDRPVLTRISLR